MKHTTAILSLLAVVITSTIISPSVTAQNNFHQYNATAIDGKEISMKTYKGKVVLVVNTASKCGLTPQFEGLELLNKKYRDRGLVILGFPCNQFAGQEPKSENEIVEFCKLNYDVSFQLFKKIDVNGANAHPLYVFLKEQLPGTMGNDIKWNFTKFLIGKDGKPLKRYAPNTKPADIETDIENVLK